MPGRPPRAQRRPPADLPPEIRRGVEEDPSLPVGRGGEARLGARFNTRIAVPGEGAGGTAAVPLRIAATGCRPEDDGSRRRRQKGEAGLVQELVLAGEIGSYLKPDRDFRDDGGFPSHDGLLEATCAESLLTPKTCLGVRTVC